MMTMKLRTAPRNGFRPSFDRLDSRTLLTAGVSASLAGGVLTILGTDNADQIVLDVSGPARSRRSWSPGTLTVEGVGTYPRNRISAVVIYAGKGDDFVQVNDQGQLCRSGVHRRR